MSKYIDADLLRKEIERQRQFIGEWFTKGDNTFYDGQDDAYCYILTFLTFLDSIQEQPVSDHHEIEVEFRGEKVTISREFYRNGERNYSTSEQDDNAIWSALRAWCEKKGITPFELYPKQSEQLVEGLEEAAKKYLDGVFGKGKHQDFYVHLFIAGAEWQKKQDQETIELAEDHAMLAGMNKMEQQMMEKAYDTVMQFDELDDLVPTFEDMQKFGFKVGDKVKVIILKEK